MFHKEIEFYGTGTVGEKGQIVIPAKAREKLKINSGEKFIFVGHGPIIHLIMASKVSNILDKMTQRFTQGMTEIKDKIRKDFKK